MTSPSTLKMEAARVGVSPAEYEARTAQGELYCYRHRDWHKPGEENFPADERRHTGRAANCERSIREAARETAIWVVRRPGAVKGWEYWRGGSHPSAWAAEPSGYVARFPDADGAADALIAAFGGAASVPAGCRMVRLA